MPNLPSGTVTFAFSDIEGSTDLLKRLGDVRYGDVLGSHRRLVRETFAEFDGQEIDTQGDAFFYSFPRARQAVAAAVAVQRAHESHQWPDGAHVRVRIGLHTGEPVVGEEGYTGLDVVRAARIAAVGRGGQVLLSETTRALVGSEVPEGVEVQAVGSRRLKDIDQPELLHELRIDGIQVSADHSGAEPAGDDLAVRSSPGHPVARSATPPFVPDLASLMQSLPDFVQKAAIARSSASGSARELIEQRVLDELRDSLFESRGERSAAGGGLPPPVPGPPAPASISREIERLRGLRDSGALTEEQYGRAVDRILDRGST